MPNDNNQGNNNDQGEDRKKSNIGIIDFRSLPSGRWLDHNYNGTWTFSAIGITIKCNKTGSSTTFTPSNVQNLKTAANGLSTGITFSSSAAGKTYTFFPNLTDGTMRMIIDREGQEQYSVEMKKC